MGKKGLISLITAVLVAVLPAPLWRQPRGRAVHCRSQSRV